MNIAVIGSGITGITTAYYLAKAGNSVTVYDSELSCEKLYISMNNLKEHISGSNKNF